MCWWNKTPGKNSCECQNLECECSECWKKISVDYIQFFPNRRTLYRQINVHYCNLDGRKKISMDYAKGTPDSRMFDPNYTPIICTSFFKLKIGSVF